MRKVSHREFKKLFQDHRAGWDRGWDEKAKPDYSMKAWQCLHIASQKEDPITTVHLGKELIFLGFPFFSYKMMNLTFKISRVPDRFEYI